MGERIYERNGPISVWLACGRGICSRRIDQGLERFCLQIRSFGELCALGLSDRVSNMDGDTPNVSCYVVLTRYFAGCTAASLSALSVCIGAEARPDVCRRAVQVYYDSQYGILLECPLVP